MKSPASSKRLPMTKSSDASISMIGEIKWTTVSLSALSCFNDQEFSMKKFLPLKQKCFVWFLSMMWTISWWAILLVWVMMKPAFSEDGKALENKISRRFKKLQVRRRRLRLLDWTPLRTDRHRLRRVWVPSSKKSWIMKRWLNYDLISLPAVWWKKTAIFENPAGRWNCLCSLLYH